MKRCPNCSQFYSDDNAFCVEDGVTLIAVSEAASNRVVIPLADDQPTQVIMPPPGPLPPRPAPPVQQSNALYVVIGILIAVILAMGAGFLLFQNRDTRDGDRTSNDKKTQANSSPAKDSAVSTQTNYKIDKPDQTANTKPDSSNYFSDPGANKAPSSTRRFNQSFEGTVNSDPIEMQLVRNGDVLSGKVIPKTRYADISVSGKVDDDGNFEMTEYSDLGAVTGKYIGRIQPDNTITGNWTKPDGTKARPLYLRTKKP